jgi:hypothetical protein
MVTYQFEVDDSIWTEWKTTIEDSKTIKQRLTELILADIEDRVVPTNDPDLNTVTQQMPAELEQLFDDG